MGLGAWPQAGAPEVIFYIHPYLPPSTPFLSSQLLLSSLSPNYPLSSYLCQAPRQALDTAMVEHTVCSRSELLEPYRSDRVTALLKILPWCSRFLKIWSLAIFPASSPTSFLLGPCSLRSGLNELFAGLLSDAIPLALG